MTSGFREQNLIIVGARPSQGKTALAMNLAAAMFETIRSPEGKVVEQKVPVGVFSMEMSYQEIVNRLFSSTTSISLQRFRDGMVSKELIHNQLPSLGEELAKAPIWIDDTGALSIASFKARARLMRTRLGVKAIVVDYLQLMRCPTKRAQEARWLEITEISGALKATAKELKIPIVCCAQLNREAEKREFGKPKLSDLRESGSIEQDADVVLLLWRPAQHCENNDDRNKLAQLLHFKDNEGDELWDKKGKKGKDDRILTKDQRKDRDTRLDTYAELLLKKQRNGPTGEVVMRFTPELTLFEGVEKKAYSNNPEERQQTREEDPF
jgi:replicative DNA helicase